MGAETKMGKGVKMSLGRRKRAALVYLTDFVLSLTSAETKMGKGVKMSLGRRKRAALFLS
jgi:hypothetical protein